jgi:hypothetical protein
MVQLKKAFRSGSVDISRVVFYLVVSLTALGVSFVAGLQAADGQTPAYFLVKDLTSTITSSLRLTAEEAPTFTGTRPSHFLQPARYAGDGVTVNDPETNQSDLILLAGFLDRNNEVRLIRRDGKVVARWPVRFHDLFPNPDFIPARQAPKTDWNIETHGALVLPDGSVVFNFEYGGTAKLDRCNNVQWTIRRQTHHSIERAEAGGFWVPGRSWIIGDSSYPPFETPFREDSVFRVSEGGKIVSEFSVVKLLYDHLKAVLTATGSWFQPDMPWDEEIIHLNKVEELTSDVAPAFPMFEAGDLVLSVRELNLILVTDQTGSAVKWWQIGPWLRQHDPHFMRDGRIVLFNNNIFWNVVTDPAKRTSLGTPLVSQVLAVDPSTRRTEVLYGGAPGQEMLSVIRGKASVTPAGHLLITEPDGGSVREVDHDRRIVWRYVNRYDEDEVAQITQARIYPANYFNFDTGAWTCESR